MVARGLDCPEAPHIPAFYAGRTVFITGATGFMGKVLVERLLATCRDICRLHLLVREKKNTTPMDRLHQFKQSQVFDELRRKCPSQLDKLSVVAGDIALPDLGISPAGLRELHEVSMIFHMAATLKFDEKLKVALDMNLRPVLSIQKIAQHLPKLEGVVYVSTGYCMAELKTVEERVYPSPSDIPATQLLSLSETLPERVLDEIEKGLLGAKPNMYTFTKALAERAIADHNAAYPVAIFRPTIVISSAQHPMPGWIEGLNGPSGVVVGAGKGLLHTFPCKGDALADMLPVDIAIDTLIAVGWETVVDRSNEIRVYNCSTCSNPTTWGAFESALKKYCREVPFDSVMWYPCGASFENRYAYKMFEWLLQTAPLHVAEYFARLLGIKTRLSLITVSDRLRSVGHVLTYFSLREWHFETGHVRKLHQRLSPQDRAIFNLDPKSIRWDELFKDFVMGVRRYILKEKDQDMQQAKRHLKRMFYLHNGLKFVFFTLLCRVVLQHVPAARTAVYGTLRLLFSLFNSLHESLLQAKKQTVSVAC